MVKIVENQFVNFFLIILATNVGKPIFMGVLISLGNYSADVTGN